MREIFFRGKRVGNGEWVEGSLYIDPDVKTASIWWFGYSQDGMERWEEAESVDPATVGQFTGLTDRNGTKIFEGDILMCHNNPKDIYKVVLGEFNVIDTETLEVVDNVVGWHTEVIATVDPLSRVEPFCLPQPLNRFYIEHGEMVVVGNVYDNPELLESADG